jgi:hypothetical protein
MARKLTTIDATYSRIPYLRPEKITEGDVPHTYYHLNLPVDGSGLIISVDKSPSNAFEHSLTSLVSMTEGLSPEQSWLAVARGSSYAIEGLWRGKMNHYNQDQMTQSLLYEPETEYLTNPMMMGDNPNSYEEKRINGIVYVQPNFHIDDQLTPEEMKNHTFNSYVDIHRFRWHAVKDSVHFGLTVGAGKGMETDPVYRINPKQAFLLDTSRTDVPLMSNEQSHAGLMGFLKESGHVCRVMSPVGEVSQYIGRNKAGNMTLTTVLENDQMIHSNTKVNEYTLLSLHASAVFSLQSYGLAQKLGDAEVKASKLDYTFLTKFDKGIEFWGEVRRFMNDASDRAPASDQTTKVARFASEATTYPVLHLENIISNEQINQGYLLIEPGVGMGMVAAVAANQVFHSKGPVWEQIGNLNGYSTYGVHEGGQAAINAVEYAKRYAVAYSQDISDASKMFDHQYNLVEKARTGQPIITDLVTLQTSLDPKEIAPEFRMGLYAMSLHKDSQDTFRHISMHPAIPLTNGEITNMSKLTREFALSTTVDLNFYESIKQQERKMYVYEKLGGFADDGPEIGAGRIDLERQNSRNNV